MNAKKIKNADTETMGSQTRRTLLDRNELAPRQSDSGSRAGMGGTQDLLADTGESKTAKTKTRRTKKAKVVAHKETRDYFAVIIQCKDDSQFYSSGVGDGRALFYKRKAAVQHRKALKRYGMNGFVVKVTVTIEGKE